MQVLYKSTRGKEETVTASMAILKGLSEDGGLFVPTEIPKLDVSMEKLAQMSYQETAYEVMKRFLTDFTEEELKNCINNAYDDKFDTKEIAPLHEADGAYFLELYHGATIAFKDMALSILPHLMTTAAKKNQVKNEIVILTATSGDTGKAAMAGFADVPGTKIIVFYPKHGVSPIQEKQMVTQKGNNTYVVGITGNFDDAQTAVKKMFNDKELEAELGKQLFIRGNRKITLTEDGMILRKRAEEIVALMEKTKAEINASAENITGDIYIGCAETEGMRMLAKIISKIRQEYDHIHFHIFSGQAEDVSERLDSGLLDFGLFIEPADLKKYDFIKLPITDIWGLWMTKASPLAENKTIKPHDLLGLPLIISNQAMVKNEIAGWMGGNYDNLNIVATYNLLYNASLMVEEGVGYALSIDRIIKSYDDSPLCFRPLEPTLEVGLDIVWKKYQTFSKASEKFLEYLKKEYI